jgi:hypothetical protein
MVVDIVMLLLLAMDVNSCAWELNFCISLRDVMHDL